MKRVLVVDDNEGILDVITILLEMEGYQVKCTDNGDEVFETVFEYAPNIILLDVMLSGWDGREICEELKGNPGTHHIPILMISASHNVDLSDCKAEGFISKPFDIHYLAETVSKYVS